MSRLDDELKVALQRQEPSPDFTARVLARINEAPARQAKPSFWQRLAATFAVPAWRYAAVGAVALLLILVGVAVLRPHGGTNGGGESSSLAVSAGDSAGETPSTGDQAAQKKTAANQEGLNAPDRGARASANPAGARPSVALPPRTNGLREVRHHAPLVAHQPKPSAEAEAAKEKVLFALQLTSETLNDVQRAISDDHPGDENPEPVHNR